MVGLWCAFGHFPAKVGQNSTMDLPTLPTLEFARRTQAVARMWTPMSVWKVGCWCAAQMVGLWCALGHFPAKMSQNSTRDLPPPPTLESPPSNPGCDFPLTIYEPVQSTVAIWSPGGGLTRGTHPPSPKHVSPNTTPTSFPPPTLESPHQSRAVTLK